MHYNEIQESGLKSLNVIQIVEFIVTNRPNGLQAENMTRLPAQARLKESASR